LNRFVKARFESARDIRSGVSRTNRTIYLAGQTGIEANGKVAEGFRTEAARRAKMPFPIHPHMMRHGCGYALANAGHDTRALQAWLGHKNIQHTVRYTELAPDRFKNFWR
jgi:site-specific recombinase XerD